MPNNVHNFLMVLKRAHDRELIDSARSSDRSAPISLQSIVPMPPELLIDLPTSPAPESIENKLKGYSYADLAGVLEETHAAFSEHEEKVLLYAHRLGDSAEFTRLNNCLTLMPHADFNTARLRLAARRELIARDNAARFGHPSWYEWRLDRWGCQWDAYPIDPTRDENEPWDWIEVDDTDTCEGLEDPMIITDAALRRPEAAFYGVGFATPWAPPVAAIKELAAKNATCKLQLYSVDEGGAFCRRYDFWAHRQHTIDFDFDGHAAMAIRWHFDLHLPELDPEDAEAEGL